MMYDDPPSEASSSPSRDNDPPQLSSEPQTVEFTCDDSQHLHALLSRDVSVVVPPGLHSTGSSHVRQTTVVDYMWERRVYDGRLVATHGALLAYAVRMRERAAVRVVDANCRDRRALIELGGTVLDLAFAHCGGRGDSGDALLAVVDDRGALTVASVKDDADAADLKVCVRLVLRVHSPPEPTAVATEALVQHVHVVWCPYVPETGSDNDEDNDADDDPARMLVFTHYHDAHLVNVARLMDTHGAGTTLQLDSLTGDSDDSGVWPMRRHAGRIVAACFSPDGSAVATACGDGVVRFFHTPVDECGDTPPGSEVPLRPVHEWRPHDGQPLASLLFLDNQQQPSPEASFWKLVVTGADENRQLKLWSCTDWQCLQTLTIRMQGSRDGGGDHVSRPLSVLVDRTASHVLVSDILARQLLVLSLTDESAGGRHFNQVHRLALMNCPLSLAVQLTKRVPTTTETTGMDGDSVDRSCHTQISCFIVQPRSLQLSTLTLPCSGVQLDVGVCRPGLQERPAAVEPSADASSHPADGDEGDAVSGDNAALRALVMQLSSVAVSQQDNRADTAPVHDDDAESADQRTHAVDDPDCRTSPPVSLMTPQAFQPSPDNSAGAAAAAAASCFRADLSVATTADSNESSPSIEVQDILNGGSCPASPAAAAAAAAAGFPSPPPVPAVVELGVAGTQWPSAPVVSAAASVADSVVLTRSCHGGADTDHCLAQLATSVADIGRHMRELRSQVSSACDFAARQQTAASRDDVHSAVDSCMRRFCDEQQRRAAADEKAVVQAMRQQVTECVQAEFEQRVLPALTKRLQSVDGLVRHEVSARLANVEAVVREQLRGCVNAGGVADAVATAVAPAVQSAVTARCRETLASTVVPAYERATAALLQQLAASFQQGTAHYLQRVDERLAAYQQRQQAQQDQRVHKTLAELSAAVENVQQCVAACKSSHDKIGALTTIVTQTRADTARCLQLCLQQQQQLSSVVAGGVGVAAMNANQSGQTAGMIASGMAAVNNIELTKTRLKQLSRDGRYNDAFQTALQASDLQLVVFLCRLVSAAEVFSVRTADALEQPVLLALVQQLSVDVTCDSDVKLAYLHEALLSVEPQHAAVREHLPVVLRPLTGRLTSFIAAQPSNKLARNVLMQCRALL